MDELGRLAIVIDNALDGLAVVGFARDEEQVDGEADDCVQVVQTIDRVVVVALKETREYATYILNDHCFAFFLLLLLLLGYADRKCAVGLWLSVEMLFMRLLSSVKSPVCVFNNRRAFFLISLCAALLS